MDETVASIKAVPIKAQAAAKEKADDLVAYVKNIPDTIAKAAKVCIVRVVVVEVMLMTAVVVLVLVVVRADAATLL